MITYIPSMDMHFQDVDERVPRMQVTEWWVHHCLQIHAQLQDRRDSPSQCGTLLFGRDRKSYQLSYDTLTLEWFFVSSAFNLSEEQMYLKHIIVLYFAKKTVHLFKLFQKIKLIFLCTQLDLIVGPSLLLFPLNFHVIFVF